MNLGGLTGMMNPNQTLLPVLSAEDRN